MNSREPAGTNPSAGQISGMPWIRNVFLAHCSFTSLAMAAMFWHTRRLPARIGARAPGIDVAFNYEGVT